MSRSITVDVEFDMPMSGSIADYREALDRLEQAVPPERRDDVMIQWGGETSWDVAYATCSIYYEKDETLEEHAARLEAEQIAEAERRQAQIDFHKRTLAQLAS